MFRTLIDWLAQFFTPQQRVRVPIRIREPVLYRRYTRR